MSHAELTRIPDQDPGRRHGARAYGYPRQVDVHRAGLVRRRSPWWFVKMISVGGCLVRVPSGTAGNRGRAPSGSPTSCSGCRRSANSGSRHHGAYV